MALCGIILGMEMVARRETERSRLTLRLPDDLARRFDIYFDRIPSYIPISKNSLLIGILSNFLDSEVPASELFEAKPRSKRKTKRS